MDEDDAAPRRFCVSSSHAPPVGGFLMRSSASLPSKRLLSVPVATRHRSPDPVIARGRLEARWERPHLTIGSSRKPGGSSGRLTHALSTPIARKARSWRT